MGSRELEGQDYCYLHFVKFLINRSKGRNDLVHFLKVLGEGGNLQCFFLKGGHTEEGGRAHFFEVGDKLSQLTLGDIASLNCFISRGHVLYFLIP